MSTDGQFTTLATRPVDARNARLLALAKKGAFDFLDFGTHKGGGLELGLQLGGGRGLGVELNETKATRLLERGYAAYTGDLMTFPVARRTFRFAVCRHVLEHLPNEYVVGAVVWKLQQLCGDFLYIEGPDFSSEPYLRQLGLTMAHSTMSKHTCHITPAQFERIFDVLGIQRYLIGGLKPISDSSHPWVHRADAAADRWNWSPDEDGVKPQVAFDRPVFRDVAVIADLSGTTEVHSISAAIKGFRPHLPSDR